MNSLLVLFRSGRWSSYFSRKLFHFDRMQILLIIWIAVMVYWQYFIMNFLFQEANFSSNHWRQSLTIVTCACAIYLHHFDFRLFIFGSHSRNQDEFTVSFISSGSSSSYFSRKLFHFWPYANSLDHLDCSLGALSVFCNIFFISGSKFLSPSLNMRLCYFPTIWISDCLSLSHIVEI